MTVNVVVAILATCVLIAILAGCVLEYHDLHRTRRLQRNAQHTADTQSYGERTSQSTPPIP